MISPLRFFIVSPMHSRYMLFALGAVLVSGGAMLAADPRRGAEALGPLALLQMLAASTGFAVAARRGHLDLLLTAGSARTSIALAHLALSVLPGLLVWWTLGLTEMFAGRTWSPRAFASGSVTALCSISALAWALTVGLPRLSGGIAWLLGIAVWVVSWPAGPTVFGAAGAGADPVMRMVVITVCPFVLLGRRLSADEALACAPLVALSVLLAGAAVLWIARMDVPLESAQ